MAEKAQNGKKCPKYAKMQTRQKKTHSSAESWVFHEIQSAPESWEDQVGGAL